MPLNSCRQDAGFAAISPVLVPAGKVWLYRATARVDQTSAHTTSVVGLRRRGGVAERKFAEQEVTSQFDCSKMADSGPPFWSIFVVCVLAVVCVVVCCLVNFRATTPYTYYW